MKTKIICIKTTIKFRYAFTLVELLVVISIIAILLSILMPSLNKARLAVKVVSCASNQRSIVTALNVYQADNNDKLAPSIQGRAHPRAPSIPTFWTIPMRIKYYCGNGGLNGGSVIKILGKYMADPSYWSCPVSGGNVDWQRKFLDDYSNESVNILNTSYLLWWNYTKFSSKNPSSSVDIVPLSTFNPTQGHDTLMVTDYFRWHSETAGGIATEPCWISAHPVNRSAREKWAIGSAPGDEIMIYKALSSTRDLPRATLNAGYLDCSVRKYNVQQDYENIWGGDYLPREKK